jgi:hypothetical protein
MILQQKKALFLLTAVDEAHGDMKFSHVELAAIVSVRKGPLDINKVV